MPQHERTLRARSRSLPPEHKKKLDTLAQPNFRSLNSDLWKVAVAGDGSRMPANSAATLAIGRGSSAAVVASDRDGSAPLARNQAFQSSALQLPPKSPSTFKMSADSATTAPSTTSACSPAARQLSAGPPTASTAHPFLMPTKLQLPITLPPTAAVLNAEAPVEENVSVAAAAQPDYETMPGPFRGKDWRYGAFDVPCVGGACLASLCVIAALAAFSINAGLGTFMLLLSLLLFGNFCASTPELGFCGVTCRAIIIIVAALVGAFSGSVLQDAGWAVLHVDTRGTSSFPAELPQDRYATCDHRSNGLSPLDLCVLSMAAYSNDSCAAMDVSSWFAPVGASAAVVYSSSSNGTNSRLGPRFRVYNISSAAQSSSFVVTVRGTASASDAMTNLQVWNSAFLFQSLSTIGPCELKSNCRM